MSDLITQYERGLITLEEYAEEDPSILSTAWYAEQIALIDEAIARFNWKCRICGNQNRSGVEVGDDRGLCAYHVKYPNER